MATAGYSVAPAPMPAPFTAPGRQPRSIWWRLGIVAAAMVVLASLAAVEPAEAFSSSAATTDRPTVSAGGYMTCGLRDDHTAACWGANEGQVAGAAEGPGQAHAPASMTFSEVNAGYSHACGVRTDTTTLANDKTAVCWGSDLNGASTGAPSGIKFHHVAPGYVFTCGLRHDPATPDHNTAKCWGTNDANQVSDTPPATTQFTQLTVGIRHACGLTTADAVQCWGSDTYKQITNVPSGTFSAVNSGNFDICAIRSPSGAIVCWGRNAANQQALTPSGSFDEVSVGFQHVCARDGDDVTCWGRNNEGQTVAPPGDYKQVSAGTYHSCGVRTNNTVVCWGDNTKGRQAPTMTSLPPSPVARVGNPYAHQFNTTYMSTSAASSEITWTMTAAGGPTPTWLTLSATGPVQVTPVGGTLTWMQSATISGTPLGTPPPAGDRGSHVITVTASNGLVSVSETFVLTVS